MSWEVVRAFLFIMISHGNIIGHQKQVSQLMEDIEREHVAHAYLFVGPKHVGKFTIARWFARELLLRGVPPDDRERVSHSIDRLLHPDFLVLDQLWIEEICEDWALIAATSNVPQQHRAKAGVKTDVIGIDDIRAIQERLYEARMGQFSCCLVRSVERMQVASANAFLKILEEPPEGRVFVLTTQSLSDLLPTVVSRMRKIHFTELPDAQLQSLLHQCSEEERLFLLQCAHGAPGKLQHLLHNPDALRTERMMHAEALSFWRAEKLAQRLRLLKHLLKREGNADRFLFHLALTVRDPGVHVSSPARRSLHELCRSLQTNAHRELLVQRFALASMANDTKVDVKANVSW